MKSFDKHSTTKSHFNFRQWSRKGFAIFSSLGKVVRIAVLKLAVSDELMGKCNSLVSNAIILSFFDDGKEDEGECNTLLIDTMIQLGWMPNMVTVSSDCFPIELKIKCTDIPC